ncbi:MAG: peptide-methionine (S)-S-oxide reductase [Candidatus Marinimicrobia bacterium]|nr:peptide-methionine (S)-S-oxide reductase [Candidatus Neomarinimicrobiota bacterium]|tara:strand:+ start:1911 stop:2363 length:453 start_codon:yes stop_codon:yes gene_type:complete
MKIAYFSLGCFWGPQLEFEKIKGVKKTEVGYCGGDDTNTTYEKVCSGSTNHAETVKVEFDDKVVSYEELVRFFFKTHDPTQLNRQGPDIGSQYRSEIFYKDEAQKKVAENIKAEFNEKFKGKIVTNISKEKLYQPAEKYHQYYLKRKNII